ncbi:MAG: YcbK family protein [Polyangiaceae bacterium]
MEVVAGSESATFSLTRCDGAASSTGIAQLSVLARPASAAKPKETIERLSQTRGIEIASGIRRLDARLVRRIELAVDHFRNEGQVPRIVLSAENKPSNKGSFHSSGRALDFRIDGVDNGALASFCKTLHDTGCGFYPNSDFVHIDARRAGAGHVAWIDVSHPGETPRYVSAWPPPPAGRSAARAQVDAHAEHAEIDKNVAETGSARESASADEPTLPPLPAAADFAPLEQGREQAQVDTAKVDGQSRKASTSKAKRRRHRHHVRAI